MHEKHIHIILQVFREKGRDMQVNVRKSGAFNIIIEEI